MTEKKITKDLGDVIQYVNWIFDTAIQQNASDIHIEPTKDFILVRFRMDGDFSIHEKIDNENISALVTRFKVLWHLKIDENKKPQDGKISYKSQTLNETIDIRISTLPVKYGEKVVLRILKKNNELTSLWSLGFLDTNLEKIQDVLSSRYGIILVAGPTGSWKSTTLFSILRHFDPLSYNISTLEDPIEYDIPFVNQSQIKPEIGYSFASGLRSLVRQDPDIIMVGEIRDQETAKLSVEAALTGHLVLSTIHTNSAAATIQRLINMGIEPFLIASSLKMVVSQRLVKKICPYCMEAQSIDENTFSRIKNELSGLIEEEEIKQLQFHVGKGCEHCNGSGYKGRIGVHEVMILDNDIEKHVLSQSSANEIHKTAVESGMITINQDALLKAALGQTTLEEAFKIA